MLDGKGVPSLASAPAGVPAAAGPQTVSTALAQRGGTGAALSPSALGWLGHCSEGDVSLWKGTVGSCVMKKGMRVVKIMLYSKYCQENT